MSLVVVYRRIFYIHYVTHSDEKNCFEFSRWRLQLFFKFNSENVSILINERKNHEHFFYLPSLFSTIYKLFSMVHSVKQKIINYSFSQTANDSLNIYKSNCENDHYYSRAIKIHKYTYERDARVRENKLWCHAYRFQLLLNSTQWFLNI